MVEGANSIVFALPIYNYSINSAAKNFIELISKSLSGKLIGFLCVAGGQNSYMAALNFANCLMLDFRCLILPRFVYAKRSDFDETSLINEDIKSRVELFSNELIDLSTKLSN